MVGGLRKLKESLSAVFSSTKSDSSSAPPPASHRRSNSESRRSQPPNRAVSFSGTGEGHSHSHGHGHSHSSAQLSRSTSSFSRLSRAFSIRSSKKICTICLTDLKIGQGRAIFVAECSHSFHFNCIASNVVHGNRVCPICRSKWKEIPFQAPANVLGSHRSSRRGDRVSSPPALVQSFRIREPINFSDDEPLPAPPTSTDHAAHAPDGFAVKSHPEFASVCASEFLPKFAILATVRAPALYQRDRAPVDLVTVLDISGSMGGSKLLLLQHAVNFVIQNLGPSDRLSIVTFSSTAHRIFPLRRMTDSGQSDATIAINSLQTHGGTNIADGLGKGIRVLEERRQRNPIASIILLSDGKAVLPSTFSSISTNNNNNSGDSASQQAFPVHTFGFGRDHDATILHTISDSSGGTFSFIESVGLVQDAFARCIGGLLSVVAREVQLTVRAVSTGVQIGSICSGRYANEISDEGKRGRIEVGNLYAEEEKTFLVYVSIPALSAGEGEETEEKKETTSLLDISCQYKKAASEDLVQVEGARAEIQRPASSSPSDAMVSLDVDRQRNRILVAEGIAEAQQLADRGDLEGAKALLEARRSTLLSSRSAAVGDDVCNWLEAELRETKERMETMDQYQHTGRAYILSGLSSHLMQRATTRGDSLTQTFVWNGDERDLNASRTIGYDTPSMVSMVRMSHNLNPAIVSHSRHSSDVAGY